MPRSPKLLFYMIVGYACSGNGWKYNPFHYRSPKKWQDFARFLLRSGFDPNIALEVEVGPDCGNLMNFYRDDGKSDKESGKEDTNDDGDGDEDEDGMRMGGMRMRMGMRRGMKKTITRTSTALSPKTRTRTHRKIDARLQQCT